MVASLAVLSDIHGMLHALDAVLDEPAVRRAELIVVTGDHTWGPQPTEVLDRLAGLGDRAVLVRGNAGRALVPVKRGETDRDFAVVGVSVPDRPGQLAGVLVSAAEAGINVEDVRVEHLPGRPSGVIEVVVAADTREDARAALAAAGWDVLA